MDIQKSIPIGSKTTMKIGGSARYYGELETKEDVEQAVAFSGFENVPLILLGGGSNMIFAEGEINALVVRIKADEMSVDGNTVTVEAGKTLAVLINELAEQDMDLSALTGIPGTVGGAIFGNAGQGAGGIWIDSFIESVTIYHEGGWKTMTKEECDFRYRESWFKDQENPPIIWSVTLAVPTKPSAEIKDEVNRLLDRRIETQPHIKTAGSCFKSLPDGTPAWKLIDAAGLRGTKIGGIEVSEKHANFLLNTGEGTMSDVIEIVKTIQKNVPEIASVEMRLVQEDGSCAF